MFAKLLGAAPAGRHGHGSLFLSAAWNLRPDAVTFGKSMASGQASPLHQTPSGNVPTNTLVYSILNIVLARQIGKHFASHIVLGPTGILHAVWFDYICCSM